MYDDFFKELDDATKKLDMAVARTFDDKDVIYKGNTARWKSFANTLRLRLALRISKADPARAKTEAEAAIANGVFASNAENALAAVSTTQPNAFNQITGWNEFRMSATSESLLVGYEDPRGMEFFTGAVSTNATFKGKLNGLRNGLSAVQLGEDENKNDNNSNVSLRFSTTTQNTNPRIVLTYAEACFLSAEAKLNGWNVSGTAKEWYEKGITASMNQFGIADNAKIASYLASTKKPSTPTGLDRGISNLPVAFSATDQEQREQIGIQKWLAIYPDGFEAWAEFRRTGFPKLYTVGNYDSSTDVPVGQFIQRIPFTANIRSLNPDGVRAAEDRMGGKGQFVKLWFAGGK
ncbi:MAG: SusD/RagB family nutrient-binding outer membrane lipoprotein [Saprospiraceae bacterium]|nr:SusD/RagB family nutrient-binding outer membrane lipoprotein [Saprospiraceae bacterium]